LSQTVYRSNFKHFDLIGPKPPNSVELRKMATIMAFKVIQGHQFWCQSKAHMRLPKY